MNKLPLGTVGILVFESTGMLPFAEVEFCRKMIMTGDRQHLTLYAFCPSWIHTAEIEGRIPGFTYEHGKWTKKLFPLPDIIYDRCFSQNRKQQLRKQRALSRLSRIHPFRLLTRALAGKWAVYQALIQSEAVAPYLPETCKYTGIAQLENWLEDHDREAFMKPQNGTHGKNTMYIKQSTPEGELIILGRSSNNKVFRRKFSSRKSGLQWIHKFVQGRPFLIQPYLTLNNSHGEPFDVRVLVQKNARGKWSLTGMAVRSGHQNSLTSNLHGGGNAYKALPYLVQEFGHTEGKRAAELIRELSCVIPEFLESRFGRLAELGIDFGVDKQGSVWVLEVNSKPGRSSFSRIGEPECARKSFDNPIQYARYLLLGKPFENI